MPEYTHSYDYCAIIDRKSLYGKHSPIHFPFHDLESLRRVVDAAMEITYVSEATIKEQVGERNGKPFYGRIIQKKEQEPSGAFMSEPEFKIDLKKAIGDEELFDELYSAKRNYDALMRQR